MTVDVPMLARGRATATIVTHLVVDLFSFVLVPLLVVIEGRLGLTHGQGTALIAIGSLSSGLIQPVVALLSDRHDTRGLGTLGFVIAVISVGLVGYAQDYTQLVVLQIVATAGIGAFHPVAAAAVGQLAYPSRSMGLAWFYTAGMIGGVCGNLLAPAWVGRFGHDASGGFVPAMGLKSLLWLVPPGLLFAGLLAWAIHAVPHRHSDAGARHRELSSSARAANWRAVWVLYATNVLKFGVDTAVIALVARWTQTLAERAAAVGTGAADLSIAASQLSGPLQAAKQVGMGVGGLGLGFLLARRHEKRALVLVPLIGAIALVALPHTLGAWSLAVCALAGLGYGATVPLTLSIAQRLLPHRTSLASALMLGGAWAVGSFGSTLAQVITDRFGLSWAFYGAACAMALAGLLGLAVSKRVIGEGRG